jgi:bifunctional non-homologous end joining protein LigD
MGRSWLISQIKLSLCDDRYTASRDEKSFPARVMTTLWISVPFKTRMSLRERTHPGGHIKPCLPLPAERPPSGPDWLHEIKHDGFRIMARRDGNGVRLYTRNGYNFASRFPQIVEAVSKLKVRSCLIDGEAIVVDKRGLSAFDLLRSWRHDHAVMLCAFDLIEVDGKDLRSGPIEQRKHVLAEILHPERKAIVFNVHYDYDGATIFKHACALGCEGIVSKRLGSPYRSGRSPHWVKVKNPKAPAVKREADEDWGCGNRG